MNDNGMLGVFDNKDVKGLMDMKTLSGFLKVPIKTIRDWVHKRKIPFVKVVGHVRFRRSDIETWLGERSVSCR